MNSWRRSGVFIDNSEHVTFINLIEIVDLNK